MFSKRIRNVEPSGTVTLSNKVKRLKNQGLDILSFTLGEPDFPTPEHIVEAAKKALDEGMTHYTSSFGIPELRTAIANRYNERNGMDISKDNVIVMPAKFALYAAMQSFINRGEEVIFSNPAWVSYGPMVQLARGVPVRVKMRYNDGWHLDIDAIRSHITSKTKAIILNTPDNPTGSVITKNELEEIAEIAVDKDLLIISDEIYEDIIYDGERHVSIGAFENVQERSVIISGLSKSYAMTGWRLGWFVGSKEAIKMVNKLQQHSLTCLPPFIQMGAVAALEGGDERVREMVVEFQKRRDFLIPLLNRIDGISCEVPKGAFYAFFKIDIGFNSVDLADMLLYKAHVALTPGSAFGSMGAGHMRMSYAASMDEIKEGVKRIEDFVDGFRRDR